MRIESGHESLLASRDTLPRTGSGVVEVVADESGKVSHLRQAGATIPSSTAVAVGSTLSEVHDRKPVPGETPALGPHGHLSGSRERTSFARMRGKATPPRQPARRAASLLARDARRTSSTVPRPVFVSARAPRASAVVVAPSVRTGQSPSPGLFSPKLLLLPRCSILASTLITAARLIRAPPR